MSNAAQSNSSPGRNALAQTNNQPNNQLNYGGTINAPSAYDNGYAAGYALACARAGLPMGVAVPVQITQAIGPNGNNSNGIANNENVRNATIPSTDRTRQRASIIDVFNPRRWGARSSNSNDNAIAGPSSAPNNNVSSLLFNPTYSY